MKAPFYGAFAVSGEGTSDKHPMGFPSGLQKAGPTTGATLLKTEPAPKMDTRCG